MGFSEPIKAGTLPKKTLAFNIQNYNNSDNSTSNANTSNDYIQLRLAQDCRQGDALIINSDGLAERAVYNSDGALFFALTNGLAGKLVNTKMNGIVESPDSTFEVGGVVYLNTGTPNLSTNIPDFAVIDYFREVGVAVSKNEINLGTKQRYFFIK